MSEPKKPLLPTAPAPTWQPIVPAAAPVAPVLPAYVPQIQTTLPAGDIIANASRIRGDQERAEEAKATGAPVQLVTGSPSAATPPPGPAPAPALEMPGIPQGTDPRNQFMENYNTAINLANASARPGGPRKKSVEKTESERKIYTDEQLKAAAEYGAAKTKAEDEAVAAKGTAFDAEAEAAVERAKAFDAKAKADANEANRLVERRNIAEKRLADFEARRLEAEADADATEQSLPARAVGQKLVAAVGMFLSGMTGDPQKTMGFINANLQSELDRQRQELAEKRGKVKGYVNAYDQALAQFGSEEAASKAFMATEYGRVQATIDKATAGMESKEALAKKQQLVAGVEAERSASKLAAIDAAAPTVKTEESVIRQSGGGRGPAIPPLEILKMMQSSDKEERDRGVELYKAQSSNQLEEAKLRDAGGGGGPIQVGDFTFTQPMSDAERKEVRTRVAEHASFDATMQEVADLREAWASNPTDTVLRSRLDTAAKAARTKIAKLGGGVITESDKKDAEEMLGDPTAIVTWNTKQKLDQIRSQARKGMEAELSAFGAAPKSKLPTSESDEL